MINGTVRGLNDTRTVWYPRLAVRYGNKIVVYYWYGKREMGNTNYRGTGTEDQVPHFTATILPRKHVRILAFFPIMCEVQVWRIFSVCYSHAGYRPILNNMCSVPIQASSNPGVFSLFSLSCFAQIHAKSCMLADAEVCAGRIPGPPDYPAMPQRHAAGQNIHPHRLMRDGL